MKNVTVRRQRRAANEAGCAKRREEILCAAARLFARHGYADTDTQLLADDLGVGKGTLYRYFPSKRELFLAAVDGAMRQLRRPVDDAVASAEDPLDQTAQGLRAFLALPPDHQAREILDVVFHGILSDSERQRRPA